MAVIGNGVWILYAWDRTLPVPMFTEQQRAMDLAPVLETMLRWREEGQQVRLEWTEQDVPEHPSVTAFREERGREVSGPGYDGPDEFTIGTRH